MRAPFSALAKELLSSPESAATLRAFLNSSQKNTEIMFVDKNGKQRIVKAEKFADITATRDV